MMWEAAAGKIKASGGRIAMDRRFEKLSFDRERRTWTVETTGGDGTSETFQARHVVSSAPIPELLSALSPTPLTLFHARALKYRDFLTVVLIGQSQRQWPDNWIYIHDPRVKVGRVQNFRSWSPEMVPDATSTCLGLEYFCSEGDGLWSMEDDRLIALVKHEIAAIGLLRGEEVTDACVVRQKKAYPVYDETYLENLRMIRFELASRFPALHLVGRNGMHKYNNQDHAMMTGMLTAANILAGRTLYDVWQVNEDAEYGEAGVAGAREALASARLVPQKVA
jgi:protoporphyrinogen oxidase